MKNPQHAGSQDDRAGTGWVRRWWTGEKLSVRLFEVAFVLVSGDGDGVAEWFGSPDQAATWSTVVMSSLASAQLPLGSGGLGCHDPVDGICRPAAGLAAASRRDRGCRSRGRGRCVRRWFRLPVRTR